MNYRNVKKSVQEAIRKNGVGAITGDLLQSKLIELINTLGKGYQFYGTVSPETEIDSEDERIFCLAFMQGIYENCGGIELANGEIAFLLRGENWEKITVPVASTNELSAFEHEVSQAIEELSAAQGEFEENLNTEVENRTQAVAQEAEARENSDRELNERIEALIASSDVKDVVGTHAELEAYDKGTLGDRDIIKVIADETHNDAPSYYRFSTETQEFTYLGSDAAGYTKSEADTKFETKADADRLHESLAQDIQNEKERAQAAEAALANAENITYQGLVDKIMSKELILGKYYRIVDYVSTFASNGSLGLPFDVIVVATTDGTLSRKAYIAEREGEKNFPNHDLSTFEVEYKALAFGIEALYAPVGSITTLPGQGEWDTEYVYNGPVLIDGQRYHSWISWSLTEKRYTTELNPEVGSMAYGENLEATYEIRSTRPNGYLCGEILNMVGEGDEAPFDFLNMTANDGGAILTGANNKLYYSAGGAIYPVRGGNNTLRAKGEVTGSYNTIETGSTTAIISGSYNRIAAMCRTCTVTGINNNILATSCRNVSISGSNVVVMEPCEYVNITGSNAVILSPFKGTRQKPLAIDIPQANYTQYVSLTSEGEVKIWNPADVSGGGKGNMESLTYAELRQKITEGTLEPGKYYRINDYVTTGSSIVSYAPTLFDVIVLALTNTVLSENAYACVKDGVQSNRDYSAWKLKYTPFNDDNLAEWATGTGKGIIYELIDEHGNRAGFDFTSIKFRKGPDDWATAGAQNSKAWAETYGINTGTTNEFFLFSSYEGGVYVENSSTARNCVIGNSYNLAGAFKVPRTLLLGAALQNVTVGENCEYIHIASNVGDVEIKADCFSVILYSGVRNVSIGYSHGYSHMGGITLGANVTDIEIGNGETGSVWNDGIYLREGSHDVTIGDGTKKLFARAEGCSFGNLETIDVGRLENCVFGDNCNITAAAQTYRFYQCNFDEGVTMTNVSSNLTQCSFGSNGNHKITSGGTNTGLEFGASSRVTLNKSVTGLKCGYGTTFVLSSGTTVISHVSVGQLCNVTISGLGASGVVIEDGVTAVIDGLTDSRIRARANVNIQGGSSYIHCLDVYRGSGTDQKTISPVADTFEPQIAYWSDAQGAYVVRKLIQ